MGWLRCDLTTIGRTDNHLKVISSLRQVRLIVAIISMTNTRPRNPPLLDDIFAGRCLQLGEFRGGFSTW